MTGSSNHLDLKSIRKVHIVGICGTLMGAFAAYLKRSGIEVTGSDQNVYPPMSTVLEDAGVQLLQGYRVENLEYGGRRPDLVVIGNVIGATNPEAAAVIQGGFTYSSLPEAMEKLFLSKTQNLVVAGTHGKTTTSSMLAHILNFSKKDPNYFIGGVSQDLPFSFHIADLKPKQLFVLEGDEYDTAFWDKVPKFNHYLPDDVILTSVEYDHADIYSDLKAVMKAFEGLLSRIRNGGRLIACLDYENVEKLIAPIKGSKSFQLLTYGTVNRGTEGPRFTPGKTEFNDEWTRFEVQDQGRVVDEITMQSPGMHNVLNALAVWIECRELKIPQEEVREGFRCFKGVKRRQEIRGEVNKVTVIDDFAHHPTAVRETLRALKLKFGKRRLIAVFEPRSATSRRKIFQQDYALAFQEADEVYIAKPFDQSRIAEDDQFSSETLIQDMVKLGKNAYLMNSVDEGVKKIAAISQPQDVVAVLSNGGFEGFIPKLLDLLSKK